MIDTIYEAFSDALKNEVVLTGVLFILGVSWYLRKRSYAPDIASFATTTGIFFTFFGIVVAVHSLGSLDNQSDGGIKSELDKLLTGIYVAFVPSIFGAGIAVLTHIFPGLFPPPPLDKNKNPSDVDQQILQEIQRLNKNLVGNGETSLITRLEKFQLAVTEKQEDLIKEFRELSKQIAEKIIDALSESMKELNQKLSEQLGDNFRRFADVFPKLLDWQENYRKTIEDTQTQLETQSKHLQQMLDTFDSSQQAFEAIAKHTDAIAKHTDTISKCANNLVVKTSDIISGLNQASDSVAAIKDSAEKLNVAAKQFTKSMETQIGQVEQQSVLLSESATSLKTTASAIKKAAENIDELSYANKKLHSLVEKLTNAVRTLEGFQTGMDQLAAELKQKADAIENNMKHITESAVRQLASNLRGISEVLVNDYTAVHDAIRQIREQHERKK